MSRAKIVTVKMPPYYMELIDGLVSRGLYSSRSEFIREAVRQLLSQYYTAEELVEKPVKDRGGVKVITLPIEDENLLG